MGKYQAPRQRGPSTSTRTTVNPYMRGIGCAFMLIVPVFAYMVGLELAKRNFALGILPFEWYGYMTFSPAVYALSGLSAVANFLSSIPYLPATLTFTFIIIIVVGGFLTILYGYIYALFAPSKHGPFDVPAPRIKTKKYKR